jgi:hypothetical protein
MRARSVKVGKRGTVAVEEGESPTGDPQCAFGIPLMFETIRRAVHQETRSRSPEHDSSS